MPTIRCEFHRLRAGAVTPLRHEVGSSVWQVFEGTGVVALGEEEHGLEKGDLFVVPSWTPWSLRAGSQLDLFRFNDGPVIDRLRFARTYVPSADGAR
jgi:gentisate 1,2-dioxygenase